MNRKRTTKWAIYLSVVLCVFMLAVAEGLENRVDVSFNPINGDFQHYNMFRRLLDGQVPFRDFFVMLGLGVMYTNSLVLLFIGKTFANGVFSTHFLLVLSGAFVVFVLFYIFFNNKTLAAGVSLLFTFYTVSFDMVRDIVTGFLPGTSSVFDLAATLTSGVTPLFAPDNASRPLRQMILYFAVFLLFALVMKHHSDHRAGTTLLIILYGAFSGLCFLWANDYGPATYVGLSFCLFLWFSKKWIRKELPFIKLICYCVLHVIASVVAVLTAVTLLTHGHFRMWFLSSFSTAGEVFWYNGIVLDGAKLLTLKEMPPLNGQGVYSILFTFAAWFISVIGWYIKKENANVFLPHAAVTTALIFVFYFLIIKRGYEIEYLNAFHQYAFFGTVGSILCFIRFLSNKRSEKNFSSLSPFASKVLSAVVIVLVIGSVVYSVNVYTWYPGAASSIDGAYVEGLGGNVMSFHDDIESTADRLKDKTLFSTYATAVETVNDTYQPSRYDYITFTFGDRARQEYISSFQETDPDYVSIINRNFTRWEGPISGVKWFFYRQLLNDYSYDFENTYARYLKNTGISSKVDCDFTLDIKQLDDGTVDITVTAGKSDSSLVADMKISYASSYKSNRLSTLTVNKMVTVTGDSHYFFPEEYFQCWFFPEESEEWYFPIMIENGVGHVTLKTYPADCTSLTVNDISVLGIYDFEAVFGPSIP